MQRITIKKRGLFEKRWYIWYTKPRVEKKLKNRLDKEGITNYLPIRKELHQWSDRKKWVERPLFPGYIFTSVNWRYLNKVRAIEGILSYLIFEGQPAFLREEEINRIENFLVSPHELEVVDKTFNKGDLVEVLAGPLIGEKGIIVDYKGQKRLAVNIEQMGKAMLVDVPAGHLSVLEQI